MTPELEKHLGAMQTLALQMRSQLEALDDVFDYPKRKNIAHCLLSSIQEIAKELNNGLDSVNLPKGGEA